MLSSIKTYVYKPIGIIRTLLRALRRLTKPSGRARIFLLNIPSHGNLGDHLISVAEQSFLADYFPDKQVVLIPSADLYFSIRLALLDVNKKDILCVTGGGFLGSMYEEEERFLTIVRRYPNNKIVFFPQSIYYEPTKKGDYQIMKASEVYNKHKNLFFSVREKNTFRLLSERMIPLKKDCVSLTPDIALYCHFVSTRKRDGVLWCIRQDAEAQKENRPLIESIQRVLSGIDIVQHHTDTYVHRPIPLESEKTEVENKIKEFASSRLVITDRLHGMIYSIITDTPVIALDSLSKKVSQVYQLWLKDTPYVRFIFDEASTKQAIEELLATNDPHYNNTKIKRKFKPIIDAIKE